MIDQVTQELTVIDIRQETDTVKRFRLVPAGTERLAPFAPGSHITTWLADAEGATYERNYSLCGDPDERRFYEIAIARHADSRGGSRLWHESVQPGTRVRASLPKCHFALASRARRHILIAGGIGITPFLTMMTALTKRGELFELHYAARSQSDCAFYTVIAKQYPNAQFYFSSENRRLTPSLLADRPIGTHVYVCGPDRMIREFSEVARELGYPKAAVHFERFSARSAADDRPFTVHLAQSRRTLEVPAELSLLDVLHQNGVPVPYSCRVGGCGTCQVAVCDGEIDHRDFYLNEAEQADHRVMLACVSRARGTSIVLDL